VVEYVLQMMIEGSAIKSNDSKEQGFKVVDVKYVRSLTRLMCISMQ